MTDHTTPDASSSFSATITAPPSSTPSYSPAGPLPVLASQNSVLTSLEELWSGYSSDPLLSAYCVSSAWAFYTNQTVRTTTVSSAALLETSGSIYSSTFTLTETVDPTLTFNPPCCSSCSLDAHQVQLMYWPTPSPSGFTESTIVNSDGFTL